MVVVVDMVVMVDMVDRVDDVHCPLDMEGRTLQTCSTQCKWWIWCLQWTKWTWRTLWAEILTALLIPAKKSTPWICCVLGIYLVKVSFSKSHNIQGQKLDHRRSPATISAVFLYCSFLLWPAKGLPLPTWQMHWQHLLSTQHLASACKSVKILPLKGFTVKFTRLKARRLSFLSRNYFEDFVTRLHLKAENVDIFFLPNLC